MNRFAVILSVALMGVLLCGGLTLGAVATFDFETAWSADYAPGWENTLYRHGDPPVGKMMQYTTTAHTGTGGVKVIADSTPESWMWWVGVNIANVNPEAMKKEYNPYFSAWYFDEGDSGGTDPAGQTFVVPSWVNGYTGPLFDEDWTDIQLGARDNVEDNYYYVVCGENMVGWEDSGVGRKNGEWVELKMQLLDADGKVHFSIDGTEVGSSYRNDYVDLGATLGLYTRFAAPLSGWTEKPSTIWDDVTIGSAYEGSAIVPEPATLIIWSILGSLGLVVGWRRSRRAN